MSNVLQGNFPGDGKGSGGSGPEDPMLDGRVARLEERSERIERILQDMAPRIVDMHARMASRDDLNRVEQSLRADMAAVRLESKSDIGAARTDIARIDGRLDQLDKRIASLPTTWQIVGLVSGMLIGIAGIIFAVGNYFKS